jgi:uncharacterized protein YjbJ (UPF0337 family)
MGEIIDKVKGKIKQAAGAMAGDKKLEREGKVDEAKGKVKGAIEDGQARRQGGGEEVAAARFPESRNARHRVRHASPRGSPRRKAHPSLAFAWHLSQTRVETSGAEP